MWTEISNNRTFTFRSVGSPVDATYIQCEGEYTPLIQRVRNVMTHFNADEILWDIFFALNPVYRLITSVCYSRD